MNCIIVCVDYWDKLEDTLPWNARHFENILVLTAEHDKRTPEIVKRTKNADCWPTNAFYRHGADFNKGLAIEEGFDLLGREGWLCHLDADVLIPKDADLEFDIAPGSLYLVRRRMCLEQGEWQGETDWQQWPLSQELLFVSGYLQIFHARDPVLAQRPWYPTGWRHAGQSDTHFNDKWAGNNRQRHYPWNVLHLGVPRENWWGRTTKFPDGTYPPGARWRRRRMAQMDADRLSCGFEKEKV